MFKLKKFINIFNLVVVCSLMVFSFTYFQYFNTKLNTYAFNNVYTYDTDTTATENYGVVSKAIDSIQSVEYKGLPIFSFSGNNNTGLVIEFLSSSSHFTSSKSFNKLAFCLYSDTIGHYDLYSDNYESNTSFIGYSTNGSAIYYNGSIQSHGSTFYRYLVEFTNTDIVYFCNSYINDLSVGNYGFDYTDNNSNLVSYFLYDNLGSIIDMRSQTNFNFSSVYDYDNYSLNTFLFNSINGDADFIYKDSRGSTPVYYDYYILKDCESSAYFNGLTNLKSIVRLYNDNSDTTYYTFQAVSIYNMYMWSNQDISHDDFGDFVSTNGYFRLNGILGLYLNFLIYQPVYRTKNTLLIYNYGYDNFIFNVSRVTYRLMKNNDYYDVIYNGSLPNYTYITINNKNVNNIIFDEYIYLTFNFNDLSTFNTLDNFSLGFDFNFTYWTEPFIIGQSQYVDYNFKPDFMDARIRFSLDPLELVFPVEAWAYNALVYICFYMPLISQILSPFSPFIGGILTSFNFVIGLIPNGAFLLDLLRFVFAYALVSTLVPFFIYIGGKTKSTIISVRKGRAEYKKNKEKYDINQIILADKLARKRENLYKPNYDKVIDHDLSNKSRVDAYREHLKVTRRRR